MSAAQSASPSILIIGAGIAGLMLALHLRKAGRHVHIIEYKESHTPQNSGGGLSISPNAYRYIFEIGLKNEFEAIADAGRTLNIMRASDGALMKAMPNDSRYMVHRLDFLRLLSAAAEKRGVKISWGSNVIAYKEEKDRVVAELSTGEKVSADFVIGADGGHSRVRKHIFAGQNIEPQLTGHCTFLIDIPKSVMDEAESTRELYKSGHPPFHLFLGDASSIVSWSMTDREVYHLQVNDHAYGTGSRYNVDDSNQKQFISILDDLSLFRQRFSDYGGAIKELFARAPRVLKWLIADLPVLPSWSSESGRIILLGDAAHCFPPYAGQGSCMAIEDAAVLAELFTEADRRDWKPKAMADTFEKIRAPRIKRMREVIQANIDRWTGVVEEADMTQEQLREQTDNARWCVKYDSVEEAHRYIQQTQTSSHL